MIIPFSFSNPQKTGEGVFIEMLPEPYLKIIEQTGFEANLNYNFTDVGNKKFEIEICHKDFQKNKDKIIGKGKGKQLDKYKIDSKKTIDLKNNKCQKITKDFSKEKKIKLGEESTIIELTQDNATFLVTPEYSTCSYLFCEAEIIIKNKGNTTLDIDASSLHINVSGVDNCCHNIYYYSKKTEEKMTGFCIDDDCNQTEQRLSNVTSIKRYDVSDDNIISLVPNQEQVFYIQAKLPNEETQFKYDVSIFHANQWFIIDPYFNTTNTSFSNGTFTNTYINESGFVQQNLSFTTGQYESEIFECPQGACEWNTIEWYQGLNYREPLPDNQGTDTGDYIYPFDMSDNILLMHMDDPGATIEDYSGFGHNGTYNGTKNQDPGMINYSIGFDDTTIIIPHTTTLDTPDELTATAWFNYTSVGNQVMISRQNNFVVYNKVGTEFRIYLYVGGTWNNGQGNLAYPLSNLNEGQWYHFATSYNTSEGILRLYINGKEVANLDLQTTTDPISTPTNDYIIGTHYTATANSFKGNLDEVTLFNRTLTPEEIKQIFKRGIADKLDVSVRSCDDDSCIGESFTDIADSSPQSLSVLPNHYFQYQINFSHQPQYNVSSEFYNFSIQYSFFPNKAQLVQTNATNNSQVNITDVDSFIQGKFISWNLSNTNLELFLNGTSEQNISASNNTFATFPMNINETGFYYFEINSSYNTTGKYYFEVTSTATPEPISNSTYIAIAIFLIGAVAILAYLGSTSENTIIKLLLNMLAIFATGGLSHLAYLVAVFNNINPGIYNVISWFTISIFIVCMFLMVYFSYLLAIFVLKLVANIKDRGLKDLFDINKKGDDDPFK